jgi:hypothetical protein
MDNALVGYFKVAENTPKNRGRNFRSLSCNTSILNINLKYKLGYQNQLSDQELFYLADSRRLSYTKDELVFIFNFHVWWKMLLLS